MKKKKLKNKFEIRIDKQLKRAKSIYEYESEKIIYIYSGHYTPDFVIQTSTGKIYVECKGYFRAEDKRKLRSVKRSNPHLDIRLLFYAEKKEYIKWCIKNNFKYAVDKIPKDWLEGF